MPATGWAAAEEPCHPDAPETIANYVRDGMALTRVACNADVATYFDAGLVEQSPATTAWLSPFISDIWKYLKQEYGSCAVARELPAPIGPGCEAFGAPKPMLAFLHKSGSGGGTIRQRFDASSSFRTTIDVGVSDFLEDNSTLRDTMVHEACHQVEGASQGVHDSPAFPVWGDSKWAEFCVFDFYTRTGRSLDARRAFDKFSSGSDGLPAGASNAAWFRDWFFPLWQQEGGSPAVMERFFGLLSQHSPSGWRTTTATPSTPGG